MWGVEEEGGLLVELVRREDEVAYEGMTGPGGGIAGKKEHAAKLGQGARLDEVWSCNWVEGQSERTASERKLANDELERRELTSEGHDAESGRSQVGLWSWNAGGGCEDGDGWMGAVRGERAERVLMLFELQTWVEVMDERYTYRMPRWLPNKRGRHRRVGKRPDAKLVMPTGSISSCGERCRRCTAEHVTKYHSVSNITPRQRSLYRTQTLSQT